MSDMMHCCQQNAALSRILNIGEMASTIKTSVYKMARSNNIKHYLLVFAVADGATGQTEHFTLALRESADQWQEELSALLLRTQRPAAHHQQGLIDIDGALRCYKNTSLDSPDNRCFYLFFLSEGTREQDDSIVDKAYSQLLELIEANEEETLPLDKQTLVETAHRLFGRQVNQAEQMPRPYQADDSSQVRN